MACKLSLALLGALALIQVLNVAQATEHPKTVCYYEYWVHYRHGDGKQEPSDIGKLIRFFDENENYR